MMASLFRHCRKPVRTARQNAQGCGSKGIWVGSFGEKLRREREMRGITLEEIAAATKIGSRSLRALETEDFAQLPGGIFNKGFVRSYARYLGIDTEQAVADFLAAEAIHSQNAPNGTATSGVDSATSSPAGAGFPWVLVAVVIVVAALVFGGWKYWTGRSARANATQAGQPSAPAPQQRPPALPPSPQQAARRGTAGDAASTPPAVSPSPADTPHAAASSPSGVEPKASPSADSTEAGSFIVSLRANQDSWISVTADGKTLIEDGMLYAAAERSFRAHDRVVLKLGNAGGVEVSYNGKPLTLSAQSNQVKTLVFTPQGLAR
jgi:cytoskeleton protein RodZ